MSFGTNLRYLRVQKGLTLQEMADALDVSKNYLSKLEHDNAKLKPEFLPKLCNVLEVKFEDLYRIDLPFINK